MCSLNLRAESSTTPRWVVTDDCLTGILLKAKGSKVEGFGLLEKRTSTCLIQTIFPQPPLLEQ